MKAKLSPRQAFTLYGVILGFVFAFYIVGLFIGKNYVEETAALTIPESVREPVADVAPMLDFYQQLERRETASEEPAFREPSSMDGGEGDLAPSSRTSQGETASEEATPVEAEPPERPADVQEANRDTILNRDSDAEVLDDSDGPTSTGEPDARYTIQIGAFSTEQEARQVLLRLEARNFPARVHSPISDESPPYYRVWVGAFSSAAEARRLEEQLKAESFPTYLKKLD